VPCGGGSQTSLFIGELRSGSFPASVRPGSFEGDEGEFQMRQARSGLRTLAHACELRQTAITQTKGKIKSDEASARTWPRQSARAGRGSSRPGEDGVGEGESEFIPPPALDLARIDRPVESASVSASVSAARDPLRVQGG